MSAVVGSVRRLPGIGVAVAMVTGAERAVIRVIQWHLEVLDPPKPPPLAVVADREPSPVTDVRGAAAPTLASRMQDLLNRALHDTPEQSRTAMLEVLINGLVPDEARILSALSDGSRHPLVHIAEPGLGGVKKCVLENASSVGRSAGVALPDRTPAYVTRLLGFGLLETGEEDTDLRAEYEILLTDPTVRAAVSAVSKGPLTARVIRQTLKISALGHELWEAAQ